MLQIAFSLAVLILSVVIHEVSHGFVADALGDPTARLEGRLTLNPLTHLDPVGSFLVPLATYSFGGFLFGWAKPVPYNPYNLRAGKWGPAIVAFAGPAANALIAVLVSLLIRAGFQNDLLAQVVLVNLVLAVFNLVPVPPLDGSKVLFALLPYRWRAVEEWTERFQWLLLFLLVFYVWRFIIPLVFLAFQLLVG